MHVTFTWRWITFSPPTRTVSTGPFSMRHASANFHSWNITVGRHLWMKFHWNWIELIKIYSARVNSMNGRTRLSSDDKFQVFFSIKKRKNGLSWPFLSLGVKSVSMSTAVDPAIISAEKWLWFSPVDEISRWAMSILERKWIWWNSTIRWNFLNEPTLGLIFSLHSINQITILFNIKLKLIISAIK